MSEMKNDLFDEKIDDLYSNGKLVVKDQGWETKDAYLSLVHVGLTLPTTKVGGFSGHRPPPN